MKCDHDNTCAWYPNTGDFSDESCMGLPIEVETPKGTFTSLELCLDCGKTFTSYLESRTTTATLRTLRRNVEKRRKKL